MKNFYLYFFAFWFTTLFFYSYPQNPKWISYSFCNKIITIAEESEFIWTGTDAGLFKINKSTGANEYLNKCNSGLPDNEIRSLAIDKFGNKWIGTTMNAGLTKFDGKTLTNYSSSNSGLPNNSVKSLGFNI